MTELELIEQVFDKAAIPAIQNLFPVPHSINDEKSFPDLNRSSLEQVPEPDQAPLPIVRMELNEDSFELVDIQG